MIDFDSKFAPPGNLAVPQKFGMRCQLCAFNKDKSACGQAPCQPDSRPDETWCYFVKTQAEGERYIGAIGDKNGNAYHLVLLPGDNGPASHAAQLEWAKSIGGDLPKKLEAAMLFAHAKEEFNQNWYWTNELSTNIKGQENPDWIWCQDFSHGLYLGYYHKDCKLRARAVRRVQIS